MPIAPAMRFRFGPKECADLPQTLIDPLDTFTVMWHIHAMDRMNDDAAIKAWTTLLGTDRVLTGENELGRYQRNVSGLNRRITAILKPDTVEQVQAVVRIAREQRRPIYTISKGKNWGMGSRLPVRDGCAVLDLGGLNRIREINAEQHYAVVEPGVTQKQLHDELRRRNLPMILNVIGSGLDTSLIGNALDRGVGYFAGRGDALSGMEVVLGDGTLLHTGFSRFPGAKTAHVYRHGLGPSLDGLFQQSNCGIVTAAAVELLPWRDQHLSMIAKIDDPAKLPALVEALADLRRRDIVRMVVHIGNRHRSFSTLAPLVYQQLKQNDPDAGDAELRERAARLLEKEGFGPWSAVAGISGTPAMLRAAAREFRKAVSPIASVTCLNQKKFETAGRILNALSFLPAMRRKKIVVDAMHPVFGLSYGIPTNEALRSVYWGSGEPMPGADEPLEPDESDGGVLYCLPIIPLSGKDAKAVVEATETVFGRYGFDAYITLNILDVRSMEVVISLAFRRSDAGQTDKAHACLKELQEHLLALGYPPYRIGIQEMDMFVDPDDPFWRTAGAIKDALDPGHILSPGRYNPH